MMSLKEAFGHVLVCWLFAGLLLSSPAWSQSYEEDAEVLPKGVWRFRVDDRIYFPVKTRYNQYGDKESAAIDLNANLNGNVFTDLTKVENAFRMVPGTGTIGQSQVTYEYKFNTVTFGLDYGLFDKLTLGVRVPYWFVRNNVKANLNTDAATIGKNTFLNTLAPLNLALPFPGFRPTTKLTTADVMNLIGPGLDINGDGKIDIKGYGFKRLQTWVGDGFSDIEAGGRYQYFNNGKVRLAFTGGVRFPTGRLDDPDDLADYPFGKGAYALLARLSNDFIAIKNLLFNVSLKYDYYLPSSQVLRVPDDINHPLTANKERVNLRIGDIFEVESNVRYTFAEIFDLDLLYVLGTKRKDHVSGKMGFAYSSLQAESNYVEHIYRVSFGVTTLSLYQKKQFPVPLTFSIQYRDRFAGNNNLLASQYVRVLLNVFF